MRVLLGGSADRKHRVQPHSVACAALQHGDRDFAASMHHAVLAAGEPGSPFRSEHHPAQCLAASDATSSDDLSSASFSRTYMRRCCSHHMYSSAFCLLFVVGCFDAQLAWPCGHGDFMVPTGQCREALKEGS